MDRLVVGIVVGALAFAIGFVGGAILTMPDRTETDKILKQAKEEAGWAKEEADMAIKERNRLKDELKQAKEEARIAIEERDDAQATIASMKAQVVKFAASADAVIEGFKDERDSAIAELNQVKQQYNAALSKRNETRSSLNPEEKGDYDFQEVSTNIKPTFILPDNLAIGNWVYRAYNVYDNNSGRYSAAIMLEIEIIPDLMTLPPIGLNIQVLRGGNKIVGTGMLIATELKIGKKSRYKGIVTVESFSDIEIIRILKI